MEPRLELYQSELIKKSLPLAEKVVEAFYAYPRHLFIPEYSLEKAYEDHPLLLFEKPPFVSTISQPSFVLRILDMMELAEEQRVFELGAGSGWNTALLSHLVGASGEVVSTEIIPEVAKRAQSILQKLKIKNVKVLNCDGFEGAKEEGLFERIIFTAGTKEFPQKLFEKLQEDGLMVVVRKNDFGGDVLELIQKKAQRAEVKISIPCSFVSVIRSKELRPQHDQNF